MLGFIKRLVDSWKNDPVKHCDVYKDKANGSCAHVDGPLCDFPKCSMLQEYRQNREIALDGGKN